MIFFPKGSKELEKIITRPATHSTLTDSSILAENTVVDIRGNAPSTDKIGDSSVRTKLGSTKDVGKYQITQEHVEGISHEKLEINKEKEMVLENFHRP
jgi:hypothetical protein